PMAMAPGTMKPSNPKGVLILVHLLFMFLFPLALSPALLPWAVEMLVQSLGGVRVIGLGLLLSLLECAAVVFLYRLALRGQGRLLQAREQQILDLVNTKEE